MLRGYPYISCQILSDCLHEIVGQSVSGSDNRELRECAIERSIAYRESVAKHHYPYFPVAGGMNLTQLVAGNSIGCIEVMNGFLA